MMTGLQKERGQQRNGLRGKAFFKSLLWSLSAFLFLWIVWLIAYKAAGNDYLVPSFSDSLREARNLLGQKSFWRAFGATCLRTLLAFFFSFAAAFVLSVAAYLLPPFGKFLAPVVSVLRSLPTMAIILILLIWTTPKAAPVIVTFLAVFPLLYTGMNAALSSVPSELREMSRVYRIPHVRRIFGLYIPCAAPYLLRESAAALSFSLKIAVSAEVLSNTFQSLGGLLQEARIYLEMPRMFALTLIVLITGLALEGAGTAFARAAARWSGWN